MSSCKRIKRAIPTVLSKCSNKRCPSFYGNKSVYPTINQYNNYVHVIQCSICSTSWIVCYPCKKRFELSRSQKAAEHFSTKHSIEHTNFTHSTRASAGFTRDTSNDNFTSPPAQHENTTHSHEIISQTPNISASDFNASSSLFFKDQIVNGKEAISRLVARAFVQTSVSTTQVPTPRETELHIKSTKFLSQLPGSMHTEFIDIMNLAKHSASFQTTRLPSTTQEVNKFYLKGKHSVLEQIPIPTICTHENHAFVSLSSIIDHFLAFGISPALRNLNLDNASNNDMANCKKAQELYQEVHQNQQQIPSMVLFLTIWSDDFESNSLMKAKHSTWIKTVSICPPAREMTSSKYTYLLAIGRKGTHHDSYNAILHDELHSLQQIKYRYYGKTNKNIPVAVKVLAMSADRPERSALNHVLGHNGLNTRRWRYSAYINQDKFPACHTCVRERIQRIIDMNHRQLNDRCRYCCNWNLESRNRYVTTPVPIDYPLVQHDTSPQPPTHREVINIQCIRPVEITYAWLQQGCKFCFHNVYTNTWNITTAIAYMKALGMKTESARVYVIDAAIALRRSALNHNNPSSALKFPPMWTAPFALENNIDTPMHLVFQGIIKSVTEITFEWLKQHEKKNTFCAHIHNYLQQIKTLQCDFCKVETFSSGREYSLGGWIAESYLGFARVMVIMFSNIRSLLLSDYAKEIDAYEFMIQSCLCFVARIMTSINVTTEELDDFIKLFLSSVDHFETITYVTQNNRKRIWYTRANFLSLLNLPKQIETFGKIRNYWEGSRERFIQLVKPYMKNNRETISFLQLQMKHVYTSTAINHLHEIYTDTNKPEYKRYTDIYRYTSTEIFINDHLRNHNALSLVILKGPNDVLNICCVINKTPPLNLHKIHCIDRQGTLHCGLWYTPLTVENSIWYQYDTVQELKKHIVYFTLAVSLKLRDTHLYTILTDDWLYRFSNGTFALPSFAAAIRNQFCVR